MNSKYLNPDFYKKKFQVWLLKRTITILEKELDSM